MKTQFRVAKNKTQFIQRQSKTSNRQVGVQQVSAVKNDNIDQSNEQPNDQTYNNNQNIISQVLVKNWNTNILSVQIQHLNLHSKNIVLKKYGILLFIIIITMLAFMYKKLNNHNNYLYVEKKNNMQKYLFIKTSENTTVQLPYLRNQMIKPSKMKQVKIDPILHMQEPQKLQQYIKKLGNETEYSYKLYLNWDENINLLYQVQYIKLNQKYDLDSKVQQKRMCVMSPFRNLMKDGTKGSFHTFLKSINGQNYSNYIVYMIDDQSTDNSIEVILKELSLYPKLNNRMVILKNQQRMGALANRDSTTRNYCSSGDIVVDIDGDDAIIGKQVFNYINRIYHKNTDAWFVYTNFISVKGSSDGNGRQINLKNSQAAKGFCQQIPHQIHQNNTYRTNIGVWVTSELRTYLRDLYMKMPLSHLLERGTGKYYTFASDRFVMYALSELAGPRHTFYYSQLSYFYYQPNFRALQKIGCRLQYIFYCQFKSRLLAPLLPLQSLDKQVQATQTPAYKVPRQILRYYIKFQLQYNKCVQRQQQTAEYFADNT